MKMLSLLAATAGLTLLGASPPRPDAVRGASQGYPACSRTVTDRCIQLYERGVASRRNLAANARLGSDREPAGYAQAPMSPRYDGPGERRVVTMARNDYPPCGRGIADRCIQAPAASRRSGYAAARRAHRSGYAAAPRPHYDSTLVRVGERG